MRNQLSRFRSLPVFVTMLCVAATSVAAQAMGGSVRERNRNILKTVKEQVVKSYFDPNFRGVDLEAKYRLADLKVSSSNNDTEAFMAIWEFLESLNDSHTRFIPPTRRDKFRHGWLMQMIGDKCYVTQVMKGTDADKKGLKPGDQIIEIEGMRPTPKEFPRITYLLYELNPLPDFNLVVESPDGARRSLKVDAKRISGQVVTNLTDYNTYMNLVRQAENLSRIYAHRIMEGDVTIWKMPQWDLQIHKVDDIMGKVKKDGSLVIDLRGNAGGNEEMLLRLVGHMFDEDVKIGDIVRRSETKPLVAKTMGGRAFRGKLVVLIDSDSSSASEVFARVVQLKERGVVIGDRSAGRVMRSMYHPQKFGFDLIIAYGVSVTDADLIMVDGNSLERQGVDPDTRVLPTPMDLRQNHDPILAAGLAAAGAEVSPQKAGTLFPFVWK